MNRNLHKTQVEMFIVKEDHDGQRIDNFMFTKFKNVPKSKIYNVLRKGEVRVNKKRVKPLYKLHIGDIVRLPPLTVNNSIKLTPKIEVIEELEKCIIYEDQSILVLNKPYGFASHGGSGINFGVIETLRSSNIKRYYLELVHRLDRDTSGCLLLAKKRSMLRYLHDLLRTGKMTKKYLALVKGKWGKEREVDLPLLKDQMSSGERMVRVDEKGKSTLSIFRPKQFFDGATLVEIELHTGRTHQIRVHAASSGHPIAGDEKYGDKNFNHAMKEKGLKRMFLHAYSLNFHLATGQEMKFEAELSTELKELPRCLKKIRNYELGIRNYCVTSLLRSF